MDEKVKYWLELAEYDMDTARVMLKSGRYLYVGFMCHQVIEKSLKAGVVKVRGGIPPYTHNLELLARESSLGGSLTEDQTRQVRQLEPLNVECRYPADRDLIAKALTPEKCHALLKATEDLYRWIRERLSD